MRCEWYQSQFLNLIMSFSIGFVEVETLARTIYHGDPEVGQTRSGMVSHDDWIYLTKVLELSKLLRTSLSGVVCNLSGAFGRG